MNNELFQHARGAYVVKDYERALQQFTECLQDTSEPMAPGELGLLYHQIGNCLVKLNDPEEAIHAYSQATLDGAYDALGSVSYNLGMVYASQHDYEDAIMHFQNAVDDSRYSTPYKAYTGLGNSYLKLGKSAEAGAAFRNAALDENNPDPTKALLNLGVCFMALNRPMDAIASYESALQFDMPSETRNKLFANMGQAYVAAGKMNKAVRAFESALADKTYVFNDAANVDYQRAVSAVASGASDEIDTTAVKNDLSGLDVPGDGVPLYEAPAESDQAFAAAGTTQLSETAIMRQVEAGQQASDDFFAQRDAEFQNWSKIATKKKRRNRGLKVIIILILLLLVLAGGGLFAYTQGYGYPTKEDVVSQLFSDPQNADVFASSVDDTQKGHIIDLITSDPTATVQGSTNELSTAQVYVNAKTPEGGEVPYQVSVARDGIGWKVTNVQLYFTSQHS